MHSNPIFMIYINIVYVVNIVNENHIAAFGRLYVGKWSILHWRGCDSFIVQLFGILSYELVQVIQGVPLVEKIGGDAGQHKSCCHTVPDVDKIMVLFWEVVA